MGGVYADTGEISDRGDVYIQKVHKYCVGEADESILRLGFSSPCCKMVSHALIDRENLRFDEIRASNDVYFSLTTGYYAIKIEAIDVITYIATVNRGSLTKRRDYEVIKARFYATLHCNQFKKQHGLGHCQKSVMYYLVESRRFGLITTWEFIKMLVRYKQNPLLGWNRWIKTSISNKRKDKIDKKYIIE